MSEWQDIATAPKDGTEIIGIFCDDYGYQTKPTIYGPWTVAFRSGKWMASWAGCNIIERESYAGTVYMEAELDPTHWQPLPSPPTPKLAT